MSVLDTVVVFFTVFVAQLLRFGTDPNAVNLGLFDSSYTYFSCALATVWSLSLLLFRVRYTRVLGFGNYEIARILQATLVVFGGLSIYSLIFQLEISRLYLVVAFPLGVLGLLAVRWVIQIIMRAGVRNGRSLTRVLVVGDEHHVDQTVTAIERKGRSGMRGIPITGADSADPEELLHLIRFHSADAVVLAGEVDTGSPFVRELTWRLESSRAELLLSTQLYGVRSTRLRLEPVGGLPLVHVEAPRYRGLKYGVKRAMDLVGAVFFLIILSPIYLATAIAVKATSAGGVIYRQERIGQNGVPFNIYKFRSMYVDADKYLEALIQQREGVLFKVGKGDPSITPVGAFIRRFSIDELPQMFNVLKGNMSLVGPRPAIANEVERYSVDARRRLLVKPGLTGLWQVSGRSDLSWEEAVYLDLFYVENWSNFVDCTILFRTVKAVLTSDGAR
ncbi:sugar transferase [Klugiella xanthotipulae]|uniref:sugar transferase n=1 Tax=Klugiella xanthotipulae TaxID=244735 RepID=UPI001476C8F1|nr:sugar transferase [Klugiella xanthotipulae]